MTFTKEEVINGMVKVIKEYAEKYNWEVSDPKYGTAFNNSFWEDVLVDNSNIPNIVAKDEKGSIELRSFWGSPELDIRLNRETNDSALLVLTYGDGYYNEKGEYKNSGKYSVDQVRVDGANYKKGIEELYRIIEVIENGE